MKVAAICSWIVLLVGCSSLQLQGQSDPLQKAESAVHTASGGRFSLLVDERTRWEEQYGVKFGKSVNQRDMLSRVRVGMQYHPAEWLTLSGMGQDSRAPWYGSAAPGSVRDSMDWHEGWIAANSAKKPMSLAFGRRMLDYGESRVIGTPQWSNTSRTYDYSRLDYGSKKMTLEALMVSPVIVLPNTFNRPDLGNRIWGTYDIFPKVWRDVSVDAYALRHSENKIGGWTGAGTLGSNSFGARLYGPLPAHFAFSLEGIGQNGHQGLLNQHAYAWFSGIVRPVTVFNMPLSLSRWSLRAPPARICIPVTAPRTIRFPLPITTSSDTWIFLAGAIWKPLNHWKHSRSPSASTST